MTGIRCSKCDATVTTAAAATRLTAAAVKWVVEKAIQILNTVPLISAGGGDGSDQGKASSTDCSVYSEEMNDNSFRVWVPC